MLDGISFISLTILQPATRLKKKNQKVLTSEISSSQTLAIVSQLCKLASDVSLKISTEYFFFYIFW